MTQDEINALADQHLAYFRGVLISEIDNFVRRFPAIDQAEVVEFLTPAKLHALLADPLLVEQSRRLNLRTCPLTGDELVGGAVIKSEIGAEAMLRAERRGGPK